MAAGCKSATGCVDSRVPARSTYVNLHKWAESDAEFVRSVIAGEKDPRRSGPSPRVVDSYSCRQMYLRSYTFSKRKETVPEKTRKCLGKVRERAAAEFPFIVHHKRDRDGDSRSAASVTASLDGGSMKGKGENGGKAKTKSKKKKGRCVTVKKFRDASYTALRSIFRRFLSCTTSVDVVHDCRSQRPSPA